MTNVPPNVPPIVQPNPAPPSPHSLVQTLFLRVLLPLALATAALAAAVGTFHLLNRIDNSPADYTKHAGTIQLLAVVAAGFTVPVCIAGWDHTQRTLRRAARFAAYALATTLVLWGAPVPFAIQRILLFAALLIAAALFAIATLAPAATSLFRRTSYTTPGAAPFLAAFAAYTTAAAALLLMKLNGLGWAYAID